MDFGHPKYYSFEELVKLEQESLRSPPGLDGAKETRNLRDQWQELQTEMKTETVEEFVETYRTLITHYEDPRTIGARAGDQSPAQKNSIEEQMLEYSDAIIDLLDYVDYSGHLEEDIAEVKSAHHDATNAYRAVISKWANIEKSLSD